MTDRRALAIEVETPSERPKLVPPVHPRWERFLPAGWAAERRRRRMRAATADWERRVEAWEAAGRPPDRVLWYIPAADITLNPLPNGDTEISVDAFPHSAEILSAVYPPQENPS